MFFDEFFNLIGSVIRRIQLCISSALEILSRVALINYKLVVKISRDIFFVVNIIGPNKLPCLSRQFQFLCCALLFGRRLFGFFISVKSTFIAVYILASRDGVSPPPPQEAFPLLHRIKSDRYDKSLPSKLIEAKNGMQIEEL